MWTYCQQTFKEAVSKVFFCHNLFRSFGKGTKKIKPEDQGFLSLSLSDISSMPVLSS